MLTMRSRIQHPSLISLLAILAALLLLVACGSGTQQAAPTAESAPGLESAPTQDAVSPTLPPADAAGEGYPAPEAAAPVDPYPGSESPAPTSEPAAYPPAEEVFQEPRFRIDQPVSAGATEITGQAPPDTALAIIDISFNGAVLGSGRSDANGLFAIPVTGLVEGNRIGVGIGELAAGQTLEQMAEFYFPYRGEGFMNIPNVGIYFDTTLVNP